MRMRRSAWGSIVAALLVLCAVATPARAQNRYSFVDAARSPLDFSKATVKPQMACPEVRTLAAGTASILAVEIVAAAAGVPEHCRVTGSIAPEIHFEVNLPAAWNRRFYMSGNGGFAGETPDSPPRAIVRAAALRQGFVTATTNTVHDATKEPLASFAVDPQKVADYAFRGVHLTALAAKGIAARYYDRPIAFSYWDGCSTGGRQGLISAQRFPGDFDGIVAGAPVLNFVDTVTQSLWNGLVLSETPVSLAKLKLVAEATYARCDAKDGLKDGLIDDPRRCDFDPARDVKQCAAGQDGDDCLTAAQSAAVKKIHDGLQVNGKPHLFGYPVGAEATGLSFAAGGKMTSGWDTWLTPPPGQKSNQHAFGDSFVR